MLEHFHNRIKAKKEDNSQPPVLVIAFGDSVTQGATEYQVIDHRNVYHNVLKGMLEQEYPATTFSVYNAGIGGETSAAGLKRLERDVIRHDPDLVIVGFCLNDCVSNLPGLDSYEENMRSIIARIRNSTSADIILLTPNFMASRPSDKVNKVHTKLIEPMMRWQNDGVLHAYVKRLRQLATEMQIPVADVYGKWEQLAASGCDTTAFLLNGLNHPDPERHKLIADTVFDLI